MRSRHLRPLGIAPSFQHSVNICGRQSVQSECTVLHVLWQHRMDGALKSLQYQAIKERVITCQSTYAENNFGSDLPSATYNLPYSIFGPSMR